MVAFVFGCGNSGNNNQIPTCPDGSTPYNGVCGSQAGIVSPTGVPGGIAPSGGYAGMPGMNPGYTPYGYNPYPGYNPGFGGYPPHHHWNNWNGWYFFF